MADFLTAWSITQTWEGKHSTKPENGSEGEEYVYNEFWGTNYGLTGKYMKEFVGYSKNDRLKFQKMNATEAGNVWKFSRWKWAQCDQIQNQEIANLLFDWGVRRWNNLIKGVAEVLNVPVTSIARVAKMSEVGGKPPKITDGFYVFTSAMPLLINKHKDPTALFEALKAKRKSLDNPKTLSIIQRYDSFSFKGTPDKGGYMALLETMPKVKNSMRVEKKQSGNGVLWALVIFVGFKILRG